MSGLFDDLPPTEAPVLSDGMTLRDAQRWLKAHAVDGVDCPCCDRFNKVYNLKLNSGMALGLCHMARMERQQNPDGGWIHISRELAAFAGVNANTLEYSRWKHFNVVERHPDQIGYYRLTALGRDFVRGVAEIPRMCFVFQNERVGVGEEMTTIRRAVGDHFNYDELMGRA